MRIAVIGAGIIGVTTAYELACDGHEVTVFERHAAVASETSFANAGVVAPGYVTPWAAPGMPWKVFKHLFSSHAPVRFSGWNAWAQVPWMARWLWACRKEPYLKNRGAMVTLARYSAQRLHGLTDELGLAYESAPGYMVLMRSEREANQAQKGLALLADLGITAQWADAAQVRLLEPGLNADMPLQGAVYLPQDEVGNCRQFAHLLKAQAQQRGVTFLFQHRVTRLSAGPHPKIDWVRCHEGTELASGQHVADAVVLCTGHQANELLRPMGLKLPLCSVHGYSVSAPLRHDERYPDLGPRAALMDERYKVAISRLGQRVRVAGSAELGGDLRKHNVAPLRTLYKVLNDWFPGAALLSQAQHWKGARPMLPDGPPVIGEAGVPNWWFNLGHGSSGWALSCGSARVLADAMAHRAPAIDTAGLSPARWR